MKQIGIPITPLRFDEAGLPVTDRFAQPILPVSDGCNYAQRFVSSTAIGSPYQPSDQHTPVCVLDIGFGLGANFLAAATRHTASANRVARGLDYIAIEAWPMTADCLARAWDACKVRQLNESLSDSLLEQWPPLMRGTHRISLPGQISLTLIFDDAQQAMAQLQCSADTVFLDAYSPQTNPAIWTDAFTRLLATRSKPGADLVSASRCTTARERLSRFGFDVTSIASTEFLRCRYQPRFPRTRGPVLTSPRVWPTQTAIVVGAGLAGMSCASALAATGWQVSIIDKQPDLTSAPQQQPVIASHPHFSSDDNPLARLTRSAFLLSHADRRLLRPIGRLMLMDKDRLNGLAPLLETSPIGFAQPVSAAQASDIAGTTIDSEALWLPQMSVRVSADHPQPQVRASALGVQWLSPNELTDVQFRDGLWHCIGLNQQSIGSASVVVIATGHLPMALRAEHWPGVLTHHGQSTTVQTDAINLNCVVGGTSYACPLVGQNHILAGSSIVESMSELSLTANDTRNIGLLAQLFGHSPARFTAVKRHLGSRGTTRDHLPMIGTMPDLAGIAANAEKLGANDRLPLPSQTGLYLAAGFGGRGLLWSYLAGRCITDHVNNLTSVLPTSLVQAIAPDRFIRRALRQGRFV